MKSGVFTNTTRALDHAYMELSLVRATLVLKILLHCKCRLCQPWFYCCIGTSDSHCRYARPTLQHQLSEKQLTEDKKINPIGWKIIITNRVTLFQNVTRFNVFLWHFSVDTKIVENWFPISAALRVRLISCYLGNVVTGGEGCGEPVHDKVSLCVKAEMCQIYFKWFDI